MKKPPNEKMEIQECIGGKVEEKIPLRSSIGHGVQEKLKNLKMKRTQARREKDPSRNVGRSGKVDVAHRLKPTPIGAVGLLS